MRRQPGVAVWRLRAGLLARLVLVSALSLTACGSATAGTADKPGVPTLEDSPEALSEHDRGRTETPLPPVARVDPDVARPALPPSGGAPDAPLYRVGDLSVTKADLADLLLRYLPDRATEALTQLVDQALVNLEARREGVTVTLEQIRARADKEIAAREREMRIQFGADARLEDVLRERYGRTLAEYRADAERLAETALLLDRLVRLSQLREDRVEVRILVFPDEQGARLGAARLRSGADMTLLARSLGLRAPAAPPPLAAGDIPNEDLRRKLFAAQAGDYIAAVPFTEPGQGGRTFHQVFKLTRRWEATDAPWAELRERIERELTERGATGSREYLQWKRRALERHPVEVLGAVPGRREER